MRAEFEKVAISQLLDSFSRDVSIYERGRMYVLNVDVTKLCTQNVPESPNVLSTIYYIISQLDISILRKKSISKSTEESVVKKDIRMIREPIMSPHDFGTSCVNLIPFLISLLLLMSYYSVTYVRLFVKFKDI